MPQLACGVNAAGGDPRLARQTVAVAEIGLGSPAQPRYPAPVLLLLLTTCAANVEDYDDCCPVEEHFYECEPDAKSRWATEPDSATLNPSSLPTQVCSNGWFRYCVEEGCGCIHPRYCHSVL